MRGLKFVAGLAAAVALCGCDWGGTGDAGSWNDAYSWVNFTGMYRSPSGGIVVYKTNNESGTLTGEDTTKFSGASFKNATSGKFGNTPIVPGTAIIVVNAKVTDAWGHDNPITIVFKDDGNKKLVCSDTTYGSDGTIDYETGVWNIAIVGIAGDYTTSGSCSYVVSGSSDPASNVAPSSSTMIYSFNVVQAGNKLTITDSNNTTYSGQITGANVPQDTTQSGSVRLPFEASSADGTKLVGTFTGDWSGTGTAGQGTLSNRLLEGTYVGKKTASIYAISGSITLTPPIVTPNVPSVPATTTSAP